MTKKSTVPAFKPTSKPVSIEEQIKKEMFDVSDPDPQKVEAFISGSETTVDKKSKTNTGRPPLPPEEKKVSFNFYLPKRMMSELNEAAKRKGLSRNSFLVNCVAEALEKMKE